MSKQMHRTARTAGMMIALATTFALCGVAKAEEFKGTLLFPWEAHAKVYDVGPKTLMFVGQVEGTLYAEAASKGIFDAAVTICPMLYEIDVESGNTRSEGRCAVYPKGEEGVIYATYSCHGEIGSCAGRLVLTGGTGKFEGISGSGPMASRTGAGDLAIKLGVGGGITDAEGLMTLSGFTARTR
jgi:hypothetical protein